VPFARPREANLFAAPEFHHVCDCIADVLHGGMHGRLHGGPQGAPHGG
jgi:hypothetical protein